MIYRRLFDYPTWRVRSPFGELERMRQQMDRLLEGYSGAPFRTSAGVYPAINLTEGENSYYVRAELPGVKAEDIDIQATQNTLSISGERVIADAAEGARYHRREREGGKFSRVFSLPGDVDPDRIEAKMVDGVLTVVIAKAEAAKPKQIKVN